MRQRASSSQVFFFDLEIEMLREANNQKNGPVNLKSEQLMPAVAHRRGSAGMLSRMKEPDGQHLSHFSWVDKAASELLNDHFEHTVLDGTNSSASVDGLSSDTLSFSLGDLLSEQSQSESSS
eukprot:c35940_g1_i1 orf=52-417(+)